ncbi:hypothetical protein QBC44DRAFT_327984 [Cladorrhinum sp. PSN332]|nr:hypothetical protein QBC44DRAFT_327984 [Cladorrhinum sp. PSN332]
MRLDGEGIRHICMFVLFFKTQPYVLGWLRKRRRRWRGKRIRRSGGGFRVSLWGMHVGKLCFLSGGGTIRFGPVDRLLGQDKLRGCLFFFSFFFFPGPSC